MMTAQAALRAKDEQHGAAMSAAATNAEAAKQVAVKLATASSESMCVQREEALSSAKSLHAAELAHLP